MLDLLKRLRSYGIKNTIKCGLGIHHLDMKVVRVDKKPVRALRCDYCNYRKLLP